LAINKKILDKKSLKSSLMEKVQLEKVKSEWNDSHGKFPEKERTEIVKSIN
jgi:hypothetical protein